MDQEKNLATVLPSGGNNLKTLDDFTKLCKSEFTVKHNAMVEEYKERKEALAKSCDRKVEEYKFLNSIVHINTLTLSNKVDPASMMAVEKELAGLNFESIAASFTLDYWRIQFGEQMIVPILCDVMSYFLRQFQVKEMLTDVQVMQLVIKLLAAQPKLRIMELVFVMREALAGNYGPTYQRIGIDTLLGWLSKFYEESAAHLECRVVNSKSTESRGESPWLVVEKQMKQYESEQREKKKIVDKIWKKEERQQEVQNFKDKTIADNA
jgi:hypothetical protein